MTAITNSPEDISPAVDVKQYATFTSDIDLKAGPDGTDYFACAREILVNEVGSGTLAVKTIHSGTTDRTLTVLAGDRYHGQFTTIDSATNVGRITVFW